MKIAFMFPGQGSQYAGMGKELYDNHAVFRSIFDTADSALGWKLSELCFSGDKLNDTEFAQPALLAMGVACYELIKAHGVEAKHCLGLSLGEYTALSASGVISLSDAVKLVNKRGIIMKEATPAGFGGMSAVLGLDSGLCEKACAEVSGASFAVCCANYNMPGQIVISGELTALEKAEALCTLYGAKKVVRLNVNGPFHTKHLLPAAKKLELELNKLTLNAANMQVVSNVDAQFYSPETAIIPALLEQLVSPVRFEQSIRFLLEQGVDTFIELGPGKSLSGFVRKIDKSAITMNIEDEKSFETSLQRVFRACL